MLSERLRQLRLDTGLTQKETAMNLKISQPAYADWERGKKLPTQVNLKKLAGFFNVSTDYLLGNTDIKEVNNDIDKEELKESLRHSLGFTGQPPTEEEVENMANAFLEFMANRKSK